MTQPIPIQVRADQCIWSIEQDIERLAKMDRLLTTRQLNELRLAAVKFADLLERITHESV